jgi:hypothetical protein
MLLSESDDLIRDGLGSLVGARMRGFGSIVEPFQAILLILIDILISEGSRDPKVFADIGNSAFPRTVLIRLVA